MNPVTVDDLSKELTRLANIAMYYAHWLRDSSPVISAKLAQEITPAWDLLARVNREWTVKAEHDRRGAGA